MREVAKTLKRFLLVMVKEIEQGELPPGESAHCRGFKCGSHPEVDITAASG